VRLADRRQHGDALVFQCEPHPAAIGDFKPMIASDSDFGHFGRDRVLAISG